jgi:hypothetical protein
MTGFSRCFFKRFAGLGQLVGRQLPGATDVAGGELIQAAHVQDQGALVHEPDQFLGRNRADALHAQVVLVGKDDQRRRPPRWRPAAG